MGCVQSGRHASGLTVAENETNRFKVELHDSHPHQHGILEITDTEIILHQKRKEPLTWTFRCLRRYGFSQDMFLFESGRRCATGPGIFAFKCTRADALNNTFQEQLSQATQPQSDRSRLVIGRGPHTPTRYSEGLARNPTRPQVEPYLMPISMRNNATGESQVHYVNGLPVLDSLEGAHNNYINTSIEQQGNAAAGDSQVPIREINYAELDLPKPKSSAVPAVATGANSSCRHLPDVMYIDINNHGNSSSDEGEMDDAFLPPTPKSSSNPSTQYANVASGVNGTTNSYANIDRVASTQMPAGMKRIQYSETSNGQSSFSRSLEARKSAVPEMTGAQYIKIDFQKTAALSNTAKTAGMTDSTQEGLRKTRHDSSAEQLDP